MRPQQTCLLSSSHIEMKSMFSIYHQAQSLTLMITLKVMLPWKFGTDDAQSFKDPVSQVTRAEVGRECLQSRILKDKLHTLAATTKVPW